VFFEANDSGQDLGSIPYSVVNCTTLTGTYILSNKTINNEVYSSLDYYSNPQTPYFYSGSSVKSSWENSYTSPVNVLKIPSNGLIINLTGALLPSSYMLSGAGSSSPSIIQGRVGGGMIGSAFEVGVVPAIASAQFNFVLFNNITQGHNNLIMSSNLYVNTCATNNLYVFTANTFSYSMGSGVFGNCNNPLGYMILNLSGASSVTANTKQFYTNHYVVGSLQTFKNNMNTTPPNQSIGNTSNTITNNTKTVTVLNTIPIDYMTLFFIAMFTLVLLVLTMKDYSFMFAVAIIWFVIANVVYTIAGTSGFAVLVILTVIFIIIEEFLKHKK